MCTVPATLIQQNFPRSHPSSRLLPECISQPLVPGMPTQVELEVTLQRSAAEQGLPSRGKTGKACRHGNSQEAGPLCADVVHAFGDQPSLCPSYSQCWAGWALGGRQSHQQSSLPPSASLEPSAHTLLPQHRLATMQRPPAKRTNGVVMQRQSFDFQGRTMLRSWVGGLGGGSCQSGMYQRVQFQASGRHSLRGRDPPQPRVATQRVASSEAAS